MYQSESSCNSIPTMHELDGLVRDKCMDYNSDCKNLHSISVVQIRNAVNKLKSGNYEYHSDLSTDSIKNGSDLLYLYLSFLYSMMITHGYSNDTFNTVVFNPIVKDGRKSKCDSSNYRAISLNSLFSKIYDYILLDHFNAEFSSSDYQFAYKKSFSTTLCTFLFKETIEYYINNESNVYVNLLDCSKAFDLVKHDKLFSKLIDANICPLVLRLLATMYIEMKGKVRWGQFESGEFKVFNGIKQGAVLSPILFNIYIDSLIKSIHDTSLGCYIGNRPSSIFVYADDIILLSPTKSAMNEIILVCQQFSDNFGLKFNSQKSESLFFSKSHDFNRDSLFQLNGQDIILSSKCEHLGHTIKAGNCSFDYSNIINDIKSKTNCILSFFKHNSSKTKVELFKSYTSSYYGSILCNIDDLEEMERCWRVSARRILGVDPRTRSYLLPGLINSLCPKDEIKRRILLFFEKGIKHESPSINFYFRNCLMNMNSSMFSNVSAICRISNFSIQNFSNISRADINKSFKNLVKADWRVEFIAELMKIIDGILFLNDFNVDFIRQMLNFICTF